jgi:polysaccharide pyruvyl transferase WcaK-like protein
LHFQSVATTSSNEKKKVFGQIIIVIGRRMHGAKAVDGCAAIQEHNASSKR